ncbi:hypothetical protein EDB86DRAFT_3090785 [Lactarius hatsudake]|nr:hypothetical protein EDB86DRAFT_3090785 [Lactarius hatsudake]
MVTKRTIESHLRQDQGFLQSLSSNTESAAFVRSCIDQTIQLISQLEGGISRPDTVPDFVGSRSEDLEDPLPQLGNTHSEVHSEDSEDYQGEAVEPDDLFSPDVDLGMDPNISESEMDQDPVVSEAGLGFAGSDSDSDDEVDFHPAVFSSSIGHLDTGAVGSSFYDHPDRSTRRAKLLSDYTPPNHPPVDDSRGRSLTPDEELSLKHYIAWVDSRGTVKAYRLHAQVLQEATGTEILSLYMVQKLAVELTGLSSQLVDMCPKSCMAFTGEFKDLRSCIHIRDKRLGPCGEPRYDKNGHPRAQMLYTPITPVIQSFYMNQKTAKAMQYRHEHLQRALKNLKPDSFPTIYSDFSDSISHLNHSHLFQNPTDTAITISGDGAQLTMKKQSDVWVLIVTILNLPPNM